MGIPLNLDFEMGVAKPIDSRFVMTKAQMLSVDDNVMPPVYGCWCTDDGKPYLYNKSNIPSETTGKFVLMPDDAEKVNETYSKMLNHDSFLVSLLRMQDRISQLEKAQAVSEKFVNTLEVISGVIKTDILPNHEQSKFCRKLELTYSGEIASGTSAEVVKINNKVVSFDNDITIGVGSHTIEFDVYETVETSHILLIKKTFDAGTENELSVVTELSDSFILTIEVATATNAGSSAMEYQLKGMAYADIDLDYPYPVLELRDGSVVYRTDLSGISTSVTTDRLGFLFDIYACYNLGNTITYMIAPLVAKTKAYDSGYKGCEYCYMANWLWLENVNRLLESRPFHTKQDATILETEDMYIRKLDFSNIRFNKENQNLSSTGMFQELPITFVADDIIKVFFENPNASYTNFQIRLPYVESLGSNISDLPLDRVTQVVFAHCMSLKSLGDLSNWDIQNSTINSFQMFLANDVSLEYIGDISKWDITGITSLGNMFKGCFNLQGISDKISEWNTSSVTAISWTFESCNYIGDETLHGLGKWDVGNCENFRGTFCYLYEAGFQKGGTLYNFYARNRKTFPDIVNKRTDLSFVENWNVSKGIKFEAFFANNPYLVNVGDLRKWELDALIANPSASSNQGFTAFIMGCSALETIKMPSIPRGVDVVDFAKGCTSLANIELDELNVEAISFGDSPLTKQSVLNLVNAATDDVTITLRDDIYNLYYNDTDVVSAINTKAGSGINVVLGI